MRAAPARHWWAHYIHYIYTIYTISNAGTLPRSDQGRGKAGELHTHSRNYMHLYWQLCIYIYIYIPY